MRKYKEFINGEEVKGKCALCTKNITDGFMICNDCKLICEVCGVDHNEHGRP